MMGCSRWHAAACGVLTSFAFSFSIAQAPSPAPVSPAQAGPAIQLPAVQTPTITNQPPALPGVPGGVPRSGTAKPAPEQPAPPRPDTAAAPQDRNEFQDFIELTLGQRLPIYGHNLFQDAPSTFAPVENIPVTPDYV